MREFFTSPLFIISALALVFLAILSLGIWFAVQTAKASRGGGKAAFVSWNQLEGYYNELNRGRKGRCTTYIGISLDAAVTLYSESRAWRIYSKIIPILMEHFASDSCRISLCDNKNLVAVSSRNVDEAKENITKCLAAVNTCLSKQGARMTVGIRFGTFCSMAGTVDFEEAVNRAKQACTLAESENAPYLEWNIRSGKQLEQKIDMENSIEGAIDRNRFFLEYQPLLEAKSGRIVGCEVLSRLNSEEDGILPPGVFLTAVSAVGVGDKFDYYVFEKNCKWIANNRRDRMGIFYTVNISRSTLCDPDFLPTISEIIARYELTPQMIAIEVLEDKDVTGDALNVLTDNIKKLRARGHSVLLDDFGSGVTTFEDLQKLDVDIIKIDKAITQGTDTEAGLTIFSGMVKTAKELGLRVVCEGVETEEQAKIAIAEGCDYLQGYYYSRPVPVSRLEQMVRKQNEESDS